MDRIEQFGRRIGRQFVDEDIGYTRQVVRPDGKIVTIYYWQENEKAERDIAATIWTPPARPNRQSGK
jgi:hypothetical protein